jgi:two-component system, cell cycle response regulator
MRGTTDEVCKGFADQRDVRTLANSRADSPLEVAVAPHAPSRHAALPAGRNVRRALACIAVLALAFHIAHGQLGLGGHGLDDLTSNWLYDSIVVGSAAACLARTWLVPRERLPWLVLGIGLALDASGEIYYSVAFGSSNNPPIPSIADLLYLLYYPAAYAGMVLLVRARSERFSPSTWLDGAIAATTSVAVIAALWFEPILRSATHGSAIAVATNMAYPTGDMILFAIVFGVFGLGGWHPGRVWLLLGIGLGLAATADTAYVYANAQGTYTVGGILDSLWLASALFTAFAAWSPLPRSAPLPSKSRRLLLIPGFFALAALGVLVYGGFHHVAALGLVLAAVSVLLVIVRGAWTFNENVRLLEASREDAFTDALTGLGNRRRMNVELAHALALGPDSPRAVLVMFDLDGFKLYNDRFGHLAGDTLLAHLGHRLIAAVGPAGSAYRQGGDEFCVLLRCDVADSDVHVAAAIRALTADGEGFSITSSHGCVSLPLEAQTQTAALRLADTRMYAKKGDRRGSTRQQTSDVLMALLRERQPTLHDHVCQVARLAVLVGRRMELTEEQLDELRRAAELHDIGKAAIPDAILNKPGPPTDHELEFMRRHTVIGERILSLAPALGPVAKLVRASHERWDGHGYPDRPAGAEIPLGARIITVCDAFGAMTSERPYAKVRGPHAALSVLKGSAGMQFDPEVVEAFIAAWHEDRGRNRPLVPVLSSGRVGPMSPRGPVAA